MRATRGHGRRAGMRARPSSADAATRGGTHRQRRRAAQEARESWR
ncbi:Fis family transcriptional regulator [Burkholderia pseudomallei]|nr:Fis family transcriptional regulator [Burkholderia pseudomallei]PNX02465.1 Fis family transcriptional regulator [Burkholderia sp. 136(2017)]PNX12351.1 Fis family transcriptional regulator [Burkholderia sp. 129]PNX28804.1 Fis family transcriptional regulator [Burkholderia sp. 117]PNX38015.1 Fis family transcriptional regulator [Burkholderia sp. 137]